MTAHFGSDIRARRFLALVLAPLCLLLAGFGCTPGSYGTSRSTFYMQMSQVDLLNAGVPLRGDPGFSAHRLETAAAEAYAELWRSIDDPEQRAYIERLADSDDTYEYGRLVYTHVSSLLMAFRLTGDLRLLDRIDQLTELMRGNLHDSWRGVRDAERGRDGYLNWVWKASNHAEYFGRDVHMTDEMRSHALIAEVAWAFEQNRDLTSPAGVDYGERSDFWRDYLRNHFEAKWREREGVAWPQFPFLFRPYVHPSIASTRYHYYMYRLTGEEPYLSEARRLSDLVFGEFNQVDSPVGPAFVWTRRISAMGGPDSYLQPTDYSSLVIADALSLHFEGFYAWSDPAIPTRLANTVSGFIIDQGASSFARDVGGGQRQAGIPPSSPRDWNRVTPSEFSINTFTFLAAWDETGEIADVARAVRASVTPTHNYPHIPAGLLIAAVHSPEPEVWPPEAEGDGVTEATADGGRASD